MLLHEQAAEKGLGEAPGRECTIQRNHQGHQCNESRSVQSKERQGAGRVRKGNKEWVRWRIGRDNGESRGGALGWMVENGGVE